MKIGASLARVSTAEQATRTSLDTQLSENRAYAGRAGVVIPPAFEFRDDVSGTVPVKDRPEAGRVYELVERREIQAVVISTFDRTTRDDRVLEYLLFKTYLHENGVELHYADTGLDAFTMENNLVGYIKSYASAEERKKIIIRTSKGRRERAESGLFPCRVPMGYAIVRDAAGRSTGCEFDPAYAQFFAELARNFIERRPYIDIALSLGINPNTGRGWTWGDVRRLIHNPFYRGLIAYGYKTRAEPYFVVQGQHQAAWPPETCARVEAEIERRKERGQSTPKSREPGLLDGLLFCGHCGRPLRIRTSDMIAGRRIRKYGCGAWYNRPGYGGRNPAHPIDYIREEKVIALVDDFLKGLTLEKIQARLAEQARPAPDAGRMRWLTEQWQAVAEQAREIETELESIRTPAGRSALGAELKRLNDQAEELNGQIQSVGAVSEMLPDDYARTLMAFVGSGGWKSKTPAEIRTALCYLKFYIRDGKLAGAPVGVD